MSGNGWCTHPDRQVSSDVRILVRKAELACRNAWGSDLWEAADGSQVPAAKPSLPNDVQLPARPIVLSYDDEITSVVNTDERAASRASLDDEVVEQSTISFVDDYDAEQDERRELLYRNSRSAIERARERHSRRRSTHGFGDDDDVVISEGADTNADTLDRPTFEPDDFIEDEAPTTTPAVDEHDDALLSEGIRTPTSRSRRLRRFRDGGDDPKERAATKIEPASDEVEAELPPSAAPERGRFDSIPEISAEIELPLLRRTSSANTPKPRQLDESATETSSYERALRRAHALNQATRVEQNQQQRRETPPTPYDQGSTTVRMPDLPDVPAPSATPGSPDPISVPPGTSAILHPRVKPERTREQGHRPIASTRKEPAPATRVDPARRPRVDARESWWRGANTNAGATSHPPVIAAESDDEPTSGRQDVDAPLVERDPVPMERREVSQSQGFDLRHDHDLEMLRSRLFTVEDTDEEPMIRPEPVKGPINVARRERRPIAPPARQRQVETTEASREHVQQAAEEARTRPMEPIVARREPEQRSPERPRHAPVEDLRVEPEMLFRERWRAEAEPEPAFLFDVRDLIRDDTGLLDMTIEIAPDVARACLTCRNYRPSEQAGRGWCTNSWAFTHRQMVNENDIACDSTIGCWWLPADEEVWLDEFEVAADATPRVDRLLARMTPERRVVNH